MKLSLKSKLLFFCCLMFVFKTYGQVELSGLTGLTFNYGSVNHHPDSVGTAPVNSKVNSGFSVGLEANLPMQHGFRLKAGIRLLQKNYGFEQVYNFNIYSYKNEWFVDGFSLETPVHIVYPVIDRRFQVAIGAGLVVVKNWIRYEHAGISGSFSSNSYSGGTSTSSYYGNFITTNFQQEKNSLTLAGELSAEITPAMFPRFSLGVVWHQDLLKQLGTLTYENTYSAQPGINQPAVFRSKGSFDIERPGYFMVQLKYTFAGKPKEKEPEIKDFEDDGS